MSVRPCLRFGQVLLGAATPASRRRVCGLGIQSVMGFCCSVFLAIFREVIIGMRNMAGDGKGFVLIASIKIFGVLVYEHEVSFERCHICPYFLS